jgi:hypothetical protein
MEKKTNPVQKNDHTVRGDLLVSAFHHAWLQALKDELVTSNNVASAPAELMQALLVSLENVPADPVALGEAAFAKWSKQPEEKQDDAAPGEWLH